MGRKNKLERFAEMDTLPNVVQVPFDDVYLKDFKYKNCWKNKFFKNNNPLVLELGCGKGEYSIGLARQFPEKNFLGVDIKGNRMWVGATLAQRENICNVGFLRTRIELIESFFGQGEVDEIWITFPDPQQKKRWTKKRLTSSNFLTRYRKFLQTNGMVHLKTDNFPLHQYTRKLIEYNNLPLLIATDNLYDSEYADEVFGIKTFYESGFLEKGDKITYLKFNIHSNNPIVEFPDEEETEK
jgi:tRNA (guanine-N7-)-methyltransferase